MNSGVFTFETANLGDEVQSLAVAAHLKRIHTFVDRDRMADFVHSDPTACVFNSWFLIGSDTRRPAAAILPIWHGFAAFEEQVHGDLLNFIREHSIDRGPIGCRDLYTVRFLQREGIAAEWSGCLSLFLGRVLQVPPSTRSGILFIDVPEQVETCLPSELRRQAVRLSTFPPPAIQNRPLDRWAMAARMISLVASASLVVTRRLHVALPAASYGTPVVVIPDANISGARRRFSGYEQILPVVFVDESEKLQKIDWRNLPPASIPAELEGAYRRFRVLLEKLGLASTSSNSPSSLDAVGSTTQLVLNRGGSQRPGRLRLKLAHRTFELVPQLWTSSFIEVELRGFPGLSKFNLELEAQAPGQEAWERWGKLHELLVPVQQSNKAAA